ncbi:YHS domain-containing protein [Rhodopirellula sp. JC639]|uniref:YHS domain-containing protein n=1 Tax=Stieleria mannarensis TaxID=2755585 RepID=UPI0016009A85|nr:YHS domain-containing protein [Rhodopirellula sp. JC639]
MASLTDFAKSIEEKLHNASRQPYWSEEESRQVMAEVEARRQRFLEIAASLNDNVIRPSLEILADHFSNANLVRDALIGHSACRFGYCERFPVNARVAFTVEHDVAFTDLSIRFEVSVAPPIVKVDEQDVFSIPPNEAFEDTATDWVQQRLLGFLNSYLRIDRGLEDFEDEVVTDPVCGMRINRSSAVATEVYRGHSYFFCSSDCRQSFSQRPSEFAQAESAVDE